MGGADRTDSGRTASGQTSAGQTDPGQTDPGQTGAEPKGADRADEHEPDQPRPAPRAAEIDAFLDGLAESITRTAPPQTHATLCLSGPPRCGKTRVARALARQTGMHLLETDKLRDALYAGRAEPDKRRVTKYLYRRILLRWPRGLIIEGTVLMDAPCTLPRWVQARGLPFVAIGYSNGSVAGKTRDLLAFRATHPCWTHQVMDDAGVTRLARQIRRRSGDIRAFCAAHDLPYFDLDSARFHPEVDRIAAAILPLLERPDAARPGWAARLEAWRDRLAVTIRAGDRPER